MRAPPALTQSAKSSRDLLEPEGKTLRQLSMKKVADLATQAQTWLDHFWSGVWWLALRRWRQEQKLAAALENTGEKSIVTRRAVERYRVLERNIKFWRMSPPLILDALEASRRAGVSMNDLQLLALNKDVRFVGEAVKVRRAWWNEAAAYLAVVLVWASWAMLTVLIAASPAQWPGKVAGVAVLSLLFWVLWSGWALYFTRANGAVKRSGDAVEAAAMRVRQPASIIHIADFQ